MFARVYAIFVPVVLLLTAGPLLAAVPPVVSYQGKLLETSGVPKADGTYTMRFYVYDAETGGNVVWSEENPGVAVRGGLFAVLLGSTVNLPANIFDAENRYLAVKVSDEAETTPRQRVGSVPSALIAGTVANGSITADKLAPGSVTPDKLAPAVGVPPGTICAYAGATAPEGWLLCNGQAVSRVTYAALFAAVGNAYGAGDGTTTFALPNMKGTIAVGYDSSQAEFNELNKPGGAKTHALLASQIPSHTHVINSNGSHGHTGSTTTSGWHGHSGSTAVNGWHDHLFANGYNTGASLRAVPVQWKADGEGRTYGSGDHSHGLNIDGNGNHTHGLSIDANGAHAHTMDGGSVGGGAHPNLQPYIVTNYIIKL